MKRAAWLAAGAVPGLWGAYTWGSHLLTLASVWRGPRERRAVSLTFDDGPDPDWTPRVLDILEAHGVKATFFFLGEVAERFPALVRRVAAAGHEVGSHGYRHYPVMQMTRREFLADVARSLRAIEDAIGRPVLVEPLRAVTMAATAKPLGGMSRSATDTSLR